MKEITASRVSLSFLRSHALFRGVVENDLLNVLARMKQENVGAGETIVEEGESGDSLYLIVEGRVDILKEVPDTEERSQLKIATLRTGETFGEMAIIDRLERSATVKATEDTILLILSQEALAIIDATSSTVYTTILSNLAREVSRRLRRIDARYAISLFSSLHK